jgi:hypothetical protein
MLALALIAQIAGAAFLWLEWSSYPDKAPRPPDARPSAVSKTPDLPPPGDKGGVDKGGVDKGGVEKGGMDKGGMDKGGMGK